MAATIFSHIQLPIDNNSSIRLFTCFNNSYTSLPFTLQVQYQVTANFVSDVLRGDEVTEMKVVLIRIMDEEVPAGDD